MTDHKKNQSTSGHGQSDQNKDRSDKNANKDPKKQVMPSKKQEMPDPDEEPVTEADPDLGKIQIDDNPEQTKKKIPHMKNQVGYKNH
jgi:hypothetical protein